MTIRLGLVGLGKIAKDQHLPALAATDGIELVAIASHGGGLPDLPHFNDIDALLASGTKVDAISLCTPPQGRFEQAQAAICAGKHLMLEKPPGMSVAEVNALERLAREKGVTIFTAWHSREAAAVEPARAFLANRTIHSVRVEWKEDVRYWHPGQQWIWEPGGLGVFDPGINALSIVTRILPEPMRLTSAVLDFPENRAAPIAAGLNFLTASGIPVQAEFDFRQTGPQSWDIVVETDGGSVKLSLGGSRLSIAGEERMVEEDREYRNLYRRFVELIDSGQSDFDATPLVHVADAFLLGRRRTTEAFHD